MIKTSIIENNETFIFGGIKENGEFNKKTKLKKMLKEHYIQNPNDKYTFAYFNPEDTWEIFSSKLDITLPIHPFISEYCLQEGNHKGLREITISRRKQINNDILWAVCIDGSVLDRNGDLTRNSFPSSRSQEELSLTRFSLEEAILGAIYLIERNKQYVL